MRILVVSACSGSKRFDSIAGCDTLDQTSRENLIEAHPDRVATPVKMYTGREHQHVREAVERLREIATVDWCIVSAGFGLLSEDTEIPPYDCTFSEIESVRKRARRAGHDVSELTNDETVRVVGEALGIPDDLGRVLDDGYDLLFVVLGERYLLALGGALDEIPNETMAFAFAAEGSRSLVGDCIWIPATNTEREALETTWLELRGALLRRLTHDLDRRGLRDLVKTGEIPGQFGANHHE